MTLPDPYPIAPHRRVSGTVIVPGSKSITNRALVCAALADGTSTLTGALHSDDTRVMIESLGSLGIRVTELPPGELLVEGRSGVLQGDAQMDVGASGTTMRFLTAAAGLTSEWVGLTGVARMRERPIGPLVDALRTLGATVVYHGAPGYPPLELRGPLVGGRVAVDVSSSSQFATALMLIAPVLDDGLVLEIGLTVTSRPYLHTTAEVMRAFGASVSVGDHEIAISPGGYRAISFEVEPDASAAVYPWVGAAITAGEITVAGLPAASHQADMAVLSVLERMGADVTRRELVRLSGPRTLRGVDADLSGCPDGALGLAVAACFAVGPSRFTGLHTLRLKETDRLEALRTELTKLGTRVAVEGDTLTITPGAPQPAVIRTYDDHRMAMSFALAGLVQPGIEIMDPSCVSKTWPGFWEALAGMAVPRTLPVIAVDGPAGTGKTTVASGVAAALGGTRLDTGAYYRTATLLAHQRGIDITNGASLAAAVQESRFEYSHGAMRLDGVDVSAAIRAPEVNADVSAVAAHPEVRSRLVAQQRSWAAHSDEVMVVEGRDIGTVVFPDASLKVYLDARPEVRAARRALEAGTNTADELARLSARDHIDSTRDASPLRPADDAWILDTSDLSVEEVVEAIVGRYRSVPQR